MADEDRGIAVPRAGTRGFRDRGSADGAYHGARRCYPAREPSSPTHPRTSEPTFRALTTPASERRPEPAPTRTANPDPAAAALARTIAQRLDEKQATDIAILDVSGPLVIADYFVIATVQSTRQAQALARELDAECKQLRKKPRRNTGGLETEESTWVLLDYDDVVVHLFLPESRTYYALESLWADVPRLPFTPAAPSTAEPREIRQPTLEGFGALLPEPRTPGEED